MAFGYLKEIYEQPDALRRCAIAFSDQHREALEHIRARLAAGKFDKIVLTGMGASLHSCHPLHLRLSRCCSVATVMWDASELAHFARETITGRTLVIAVSQSGESAEIRRITKMKQRPGSVISITNGGDNTLARWADVPLLTRAGEEASVSNKTYVAGLAALHLLGALLLGRGFDAARREVAEAASLLERSLETIDRQIKSLPSAFVSADFLAFVGRGPSLASARTGSLITQEASKLPCAGFSGGGFRHGPLELARPGFAAVIFGGADDTRSYSKGLAEQICALGGRVAYVSPRETDRTSCARLSVIQIPNPAPAILPILEIVPIQLLSIPLARAKGHEPAVFETATKVTTVE